MAAILDFSRFYGQIMAKLFGARIFIRVGLYMIFNLHPAKFDTFVRRVNILVKFVPTPPH